MGQKHCISHAIFVKLLGVEWVNERMGEWVNSRSSKKTKKESIDVPKKQTAMVDHGLITLP